MASLLPVLQVAAPTISSPACQEQVVDAAKLVAKTVEEVVQVGQVSALSSVNNVPSCQLVASVFEMDWIL